jgi:hypothetical protein
MAQAHAPRGRRVLVAFKRANNSYFGASDRTVGPCVGTKALLLTLLIGNAMQVLDFAHMVAD